MTERKYTVHPWPKWALALWFGALFLLCGGAAVFVGIAMQAP